VSTVPGRATPEGTEAFRARGLAKGAIAPGHFRNGPDGLCLGSIGLGTYLGEPDGPTDLAVEQAVAIATGSLRANVVDTALNYRHQRAERSVGRALARQFGSGSLDRSEVFVASKNGYLSYDAESTLPPQRYLETELLRPGILRPSEIVDSSHAMSPRFLEDQVGRSRRNLGLETIDLLYLHNAPDAQLPAIGREKFLGRLRDAFDLLEKLRDRGWIAAYGIATWESLRCARSEAQYLGLEEAVRLAREVGGADHGFRFVQFPFNLAMPEAAVLRNQPIDGERRTLFEAASHLGIGCFTSVPLLQGQLAEQGPSVAPLTRAQTALQFARSAPGTIGPVVGLKEPDHLAEALRVAELPIWEPEKFRSLL
jgi:aryl-alcohol dehydrogenase-like predicted oxidoreductase